MNATNLTSLYSYSQKSQLRHSENLIVIIKPNKMRQLILLLFILPLSMLAQTIQGPITACKDDCATYAFQSSTSGPFVWNISGIETGNTIGENVEICWTEQGNQTIAVTDVSATPGNHLSTLSVTVNENEGVEIIFPRYPTCESRDSLSSPDGTNELPPINCQTVCGGSSVIYEPTNPIGSYQWDIEGASNISINGNSANVTWSELGAGYINVVNVDDNMCEAESSYCIEILEVPEASAILSANSICIGQTVSITSNTSDVVEYFWETGDGQSASGSQVQFTYELAGSYTGSLIVQTECFCFDTTYFNIDVNVNPGPEILCIGTVCAQDTATYYAADICAQYNWNVSNNGAIVDGGNGADNFVEVVWQSGPSGEVTLATPGCGAICAIPTTETIPVISSIVTIEGPQEVCKGSQTVYRAPRFGGTEYTWTITGPGSITSGYGTEEIVVQWEDYWNTPSIATIELQYENCFLECGGSASLNINLKDPYAIEGTGSICPEGNNYIVASYNWNNIPADWNIEGPDGTTVYTSIAENVIQYDFNDGPGIYKIEVSVDPAIYCEPMKAVYVPVKARPEVNVNILGDLIVCTGQTSNYVLPINPQLFNVRWVLDDGGSTVNLNGHEISHTWTSNGPYSISVTISDVDEYCFSEPFTINPVPAASSSISGSTVVCLDAKEIYQVDGLIDTPTAWEITPSDAGSLRTLPDGSLEIHWHMSGTHTISAGFCTASIGYIVDVLAETAIVITAPDGICPGEQATVNILLPAGSSIEVKDESLSTISINNSLTLDAGFYLVEMTDINGCLSQETFEIEEFILPEVRISTPDNTGFCPADGDSGPTLYALNTLSGYTYQWYRDGIALGITTNSMSSSIFGYYYVVATNTDGSTTLSNEIELFEYCGPNGRCNGNSTNFPPCADGTYVSFTAANTGFCNEYSFTNTSLDFIPGTTLYHFEDPEAGIDSISTLENPNHTFTFAGHYLVTMIAGVTANVNPPYCWDYVDIVVPAAANFTVTEGCANDGIQFNQKVTFVTGYSVANYSWDFGDPSSGVANNSNDADPMHIYSNSGTYNVTLTITANTGCQARITKQVEVKGSPNVDFNIPIIQCEDTAIPFDALVSTDAISVSWDFGDLGSGAANESDLNNALHTFSNSQIYNVSLSASNIYGCTYTISKSIDISNSVLAGDVTLMPSGTICQGDSVTLSAPFGGLTYLWSDGSLGQSRKVGDDKSYSVTITDAGGCQYMPDPVQVEFHDVPDLTIKGIIQLDGFQSETYTEYMELCHQETFYLSIPYQFGLEYLWTVNSNTGNVLYYWNGLNNLPPGTHLIGVTVTDPTNGCTYEVEPFSVVIHPLPASPIVVTDQSEDCEDLTHTLSITNYDPTFTYYWSNGQEGQSITTSQAGNHEVQVISDEGCESWPGGYTIYPRPKKDVFPHGCEEVCFPKIICLPENLGYAYEWIKDGVSMANNMTWMEITEPGEYQVVMTHFSGCSETSDILSIEPKPADHKIDGIVYLDVNENGIYDAGDQLLENAVVLLMDGATVVETIFTDANGYYIFEQIGVNAPSIVVDVSSLGFNIPSPTQNQYFVFTECIEEQNKDFPFTDLCFRQELTLDLSTCTGQPLVYESLTLMPGETDSIVYVSAAGCDSTLIINAIELPQAVITLNVLPACDLTIGGSISLSSDLSGTTFSVDDPTSFSTSLTYDNIAPGVHDLWVIDPSGCPQTIPFTVDMIAEPLLDITTTFTCSNANEGSASIMVFDGQNYDYSLDGISFSNASDISQLSSGNYMLYVTSAQGCIWEMQFNIDQYIEPILSIEPNASCTAMDNGTVTIANLGTGVLTYELDNNGASTLEVYENLSPGNHTMSVYDVNGCTYSYGFIIDEEELPIVSLTAQDVCEGQSNGSLSLTQMGTGTYLYSIDAINYQSDPDFNGLPEGNYTIYIENINGCSTTENFALQTIPSPMVIINTDDACIGINNGEAQFASTESGLEYSLDGLLFSATPNIDNLDAGTYTLYVQGVDGCVHTYPFKIVEAAELDVTFTNPLIDCSMSNVLLEPEVITAAGDATFTWSDGSSAASLPINTEGIYSVEIEDNCSISYYEWNIDFIETEIGTFYAPNIFSPNGDGINDEFRPVYKDPTQISNYTLDVFDRWGSLVYHSDDLDQGWDGKFVTKSGQTGVFVWMIRAEGKFCNDVEVFELVGDVTVVR